MKQRFLSNYHNSACDYNPKPTGHKQHPISGGGDGQKSLWTSRKQKTSNCKVVMNDKKKMKVGILGAADIAVKNVRAIGLSSSTEVGAVGSRDIKKAEGFLQSVGLDVNLAVQGYDAVLEADIDAVYIPLPTALHMEWIKKAAQRKIHILCEKPVVMSVEEMEELEQVVSDSGIQWMDGTMWMHNPRASLMKKSLESIGNKKTMISSVSFVGDKDFMANDIRVKKDLDRFGCIGDMGWYAIRAALFAFDFDMPVKIQAHLCPVVNDAGVVTSCGATVVWEDGKKLVFSTGFDTVWSNKFQVYGTEGSLRVEDFIIPNNEKSCEFFVTSNHKLINNHTGCAIEEQKIVVNCEKPQEALMWDKFAELVGNIQSGGSPDNYWLEISLKTQKIVCALQYSIDNNCSVVDITK